MGWKSSLRTCKSSMAPAVTSSSTRRFCQATKHLGTIISVTLLMQSPLHANRQILTIHRHLHQVANGSSTKLIQHLEEIRKLCLRAMPKPSSRVCGGGWRRFANSGPLQTIPSRTMHPSSRSLPELLQTHTLCQNHILIHPRILFAINS